MNEPLKIVNLLLAKEVPKKKFLPMLLDARKQQEPLQKPTINITIPIKKQKEDSKPVEIINTVLESSFNIGYKTEIPLIPIQYTPILKYKIPDCISKDSMMDTIDTGFGIENILRRECKRPKYKLHLCKENYLDEFKAETEKQLARFNLGVYSKEEVDNIVKDIINSNTDFVTKTEVDKMLAELDFVDSSLKSVANYEIPETLFKL